jgi:ABC-2 type transport system ATP-binding protein
MDLAARRLLDDVIRERRDEGQAVILVSHALADVKRLCDRIAVLRAGRVAYTGRVADLAQDVPSDEAGPLESAVEAIYAGATQ